MTNRTPFKPSTGVFRTFEWSFCRFQAHSSPHRSQQPAPHEPQVGECEERGELRRVLFQAPVAHLHITELPLDHPKRVLYLGTNARLGAFELIQKRSQRGVLVQHSAPARAHRHVPVHAERLGLFALGHALVPASANTSLSSPCSSAWACVTSATLAAVPTTVCTTPVWTSTPMCAFMPK